MSDNHHTKCNGIHAVILAGGKGTRLKPYTSVFPKPLMPVGGLPILEILVRQLARHGVDQITLTVGHLAKLIEVYFGDGSQFGVHIDYSHEKEPLGTMGPLKLVRDLPENFLVMNGDVLSDVDFAGFFADHCRARALFSISAYRREINSDFGVLEADGDGRLSGFKEKPMLPFLVSMGVYAMNREVLSRIPAGRPFGFDELMSGMLTSDNRPRVCPHDGFWLDIGRGEDYELAQASFADWKKRLLGEDP
jgi:NDP-sugar pyrophosphorylase family protein